MQTPQTTTKKYCRNCRQCTDHAVEEENNLTADLMPDLPQIYYSCEECGSENR
jgi:ribosomal protein L44E